MVSNHIQLAGSSNLRDVGGLPAGGGRRVRHGRLYRSGALWGLTPADWRWMDEQGFAVICDLRSDAEREVAPTCWPDDAAPRQVDEIYDAGLLFANRPVARSANVGALHGDLYRLFARVLAPSFKGLFHALVQDQGAAIVHCTAGQDRTGLAVALVLHALDVDREAIYADYLRSTDLRRPEFEIDREALAGLADRNVVASYYSELIARHGHDVFTPRPLLDEQGKPLLETAFSAIDAEWGSIDTYLESIIGIDEGKRRRLQENLLEPARG